MLSQLIKNRYINNQHQGRYTRNIGDFKRDVKCQTKCTTIQISESIPESTFQLVKSANMERKPPIYQKINSQKQSIYIKICSYNQKHNQKVKIINNNIVWIIRLIHTIV
ncbi:hypothetical protein TTHERM_001500995 (macronuclear) [Tetrahymena thermophila SB210]|uniref:Uncharacterized protein n=1 Tax=Tetrahymena thermophila (strain SB210) TaxID=312017 RepID=W7XFD3_TETTS|nr:hypothetical protein TTHERM_001500995 [Tetrahymena thermophila SB210]EWS72706.1 hypothetical protein TTHERM_001500995 [Tetrahymena thermophila SB210]|eukprot:XP_012654760.1 hypothetical protein TTHERM_001500995 [Tetrahymena thermophila SB210]